MINININNSSSVSRTKARVELYNGSTLEKVCACGDYLQSFEVERYGEDGKFFGTLISQKIKVELIDIDRTLNINKNYSLIVVYEVNGVEVRPYPQFYVESVERDEDTNNITIIAHDALYRLDNYTFSDLGIAADNYSPYTILVAMFDKLQLNFRGVNFAPTTGVPMKHIMPNGANFTGKETLKEIIRRICEITQTICYIHQDKSSIGYDSLTFKKLRQQDMPVFTIGRTDYFTLKTQAAIKLSGICHTTELGDNIEHNLNNGGVIQYVRSNPFWEAWQNEAEGQTFLAEQISYAATQIGGLSIAPFNCDWRGNCLIEIGDRIALTAADGSNVVSFMLNNKITYNGAYNELTEWSYEEQPKETQANPTNLGEALNQTFAKVDKALGEITLHAGRIENNENNYSSLQLTVNDIAAEVSSTKEILDSNGKLIGELEKKSQTIQTPEQIKHIFTETIKDEKLGEEITTETGFTFNSEGLRISEDGNPIETLITEDGMTITDNSQEVLKANNGGVWAKNLHATTWLIIGENSRLEDWGNRTACFWIGGN